MRLSAIAFLATGLAFTALAQIQAAGRPAPDPFAPLWLYQGSWHEMPDGKPPFMLSNLCTAAGQFFVCQQTVAGRPPSLMIFVPGKTPGSYFTQGVVAEGWATGRGQLQIDGTHWTFDSKSVDGDKTTYYRTTNTFTANNQIHYELLQSSDGQQWAKTGSGNEARVSRRPK